MADWLPVVCVETRHMMALLKTQQINRTDRNGALTIPHRWFATANGNVPVAAISPPLPPMTARVAIPLARASELRVVWL